jgi:hypothetical protein
MSLTQHAEFELRRAGMMDKSSDYEGMVGYAVLDLVRTFAAQGHSGGSAMQTIALFTHLAKYQTLTPLTADKDEWNLVGSGMWQSRRKPSVFSGDGGKTWYCIDKPKGFFAGLRWHLIDRRRWIATAKNSNNGELKQ